MKLNNRFIFGILSLVLAAVIAFVALPTIARQTNGKAEIIRITQPVLKGEKITSDNTEVVEVGGYNLPSNVAHSLSDVEGLYVTADLAEGDYILTSKVSSVPVSSDVALNDIPSGKVANQTSKDKPGEHQDKQYRKQKQNDDDGDDLADVLAPGPNGPGHGTIRAAGGSSFCGTGNCLACLNGAFYRVGGGCSGFHSVGKTSLFFFIHLEPVLSAGSGGQLFDD